MWTTALREDVTDRTTHAHRLSPGAQCVGQFEQPLLLNRHCRENNQVCIDVEIDRLDVFIDYLDVVRVRRQSGQRGQTQRRHDSLEAADVFNKPEPPE